MIRAYHFVGTTLRNGQPIPPDGEWLEYDGELPIIMCDRGLHASVHPFDALKYAPGNVLCLVDLSGTILTETDKHVATRRIIRKRVDAESTLRMFARRCALDVIHLWEAPKIVREYLETGEESKRAAAGAAAWAAARDAAGAAAGATAWATAGDAEGDTARATARAAAWAAAMAGASAMADAGDAAGASARSAAGDDARDAAGDAAVGKYREWFAEMVNELFA